MFLDIFRIVFVFYSLIVSCFIIGKKVADLLVFDVKKELVFYFSPILGLSMMMLIAIGYGWILPFYQYPFLSLSIILLLTAVCFFLENDYKSICLDLLKICLFSFFFSLPIMASIYLYNSYNPGTDIFTYISQSQWLQTHAFRTPANTSGYFPYLSQISLYQETGSRMGGSFLLGFIQSIFHIKWSYYVYIPTVALAFTCGCFAFGGVLKQAINLSKNILLLLSLLPAMSFNGYLFGAQWGFYPQTIGLSFAIGLVGLLAFTLSESLKNDIDNRRFFICLLPLSLVSSCFLLSYNEPFPIFFAAIGIYFLWSLWQYPLKRKFILYFITVYFIELLLFTNYEIIRIIHNVYQTLSIAHHKASIGWPVLWHPLTFLAHAFGIKTPFNGFKFDEVFSVFGIIPLIVFIIYFVYSHWKHELKSHHVIVLLLSLEFVFLICFLKFRYLDVGASPQEQGYTFLQYKISKYAAPFSLALLAIALGSVLIHFKRFKKEFWIIFSIWMVFGFYFHMKYSVKNLHYPNLLQMQTKNSDFNIYLKLRNQVLQLKDKNPIYLELYPENHKLRQMLIYVLNDIKLASDYSDDGYIFGQLPGEYVNMLDEQSNFKIIMSHNNLINEVSNIKIGPFEILKKPFNFILLEGQTGGYNQESNQIGETWNWVQEKIVLRYKSSNNMKRVNFKFKIESHKYPRNFKIIIKNRTDKIIYLKELHHFIQGIINISNINLESGEFTITVEADGHAYPLSRDDQRLSRFVIANLSAFKMPTN